MLLLLYQNCSPNHGTDEVQDFSVQGLDPLVKKVWTQNRYFLNDLPVVVYVNPNAFANGSTYSWSHDLQGVSSACEQKFYEGLETAMEMTCSALGELNVLLHVVEPGGTVYEFSEAFSIRDKDTVPSGEHANLFLSIEELVVDVSGSLGGVGREPETIDYSEGETLYANQCASCHGSLGLSDVRNSSLAQLNTALQQVPVMQELISLSEEQKQQLIGALAD